MLNTREADDRMVTLLARLQEARNEYGKAAPAYIHALKRWTALVKTEAENTTGMVDALITAHGLGDMTEQQIATLISRTEGEHDVRSTWRALSECSRAYYHEKARVIKAEAMVLGYINYLKEQEDKEPHDVPDLLLGAMAEFYPAIGRVSA